MVFAQPYLPTKEGPLMTQAYLINRDFDEFSAAREQFTQLSEALQSEQTLEREHGDIEELIWQEGKELLRRLLQGHLDLRAAAEPKREHVTVCGPDPL